MSTLILTKASVFEPMFITIFSPLQCSVSCGMGSRRREVTCKTVDTKLVLPSESCNLALKPKETEKCNPGPCTVMWLASNWSEVRFLAYLL